MPEYEKESADNRDFSIELITIMPRTEQIKGIQSTKLMCTTEPLRSEWEKTEASMKKKKPRENYSKTC